MDETKDTRSEIADSRQRMSEIIKEIGQRLTPQQMKERAKEVAVRETRHVKDRIIESPLALGILGGLVTAGVGRWLRNRREVRRFDAGYELPEPGLRERAAEAGEAIKDKAAELKDRASEVAHRAAEKMPSTEELKQAGQRAGRYLGEEPLVGALAALAAGAAVGLLFPVSEGERRVLGSYRVRASEKLESLKEDVKEQVGELEEHIRGEGPKHEDGFPPPKPTLQ